MAWNILKQLDWPSPMGFCWMKFSSPQLRAESPSLGGQPRVQPYGPALLPHSLLKCCWSSPCRKPTGRESTYGSTDRRVARRFRQTFNWEPEEMHSEMRNMILLQVNRNLSVWVPADFAYHWPLWDKSRTSFHCPANWRIYPPVDQTCQW